jgi:hypothetical protein
MQDTFNLALKYIKELPTTRNSILTQPDQEILKYRIKINLIFTPSSNKSPTDRIKPKLQAVSK